MLKIHRDHNHQGHLELFLEGEATVEEAENLKDQLIGCLQHYDSVIVNCDRVSAIDFFMVQLLCSAHRTSRTWNKNFTIRSDAGSVVREAIRLTGFSQSRECEFYPDAPCCLAA